jgi:hypothetical protein
MNEELKTLFLTSKKKLAARRLNRYAYLSMRQLKVCKNTLFGMTIEVLIMLRKRPIDGSMSSGLIMSTSSVKTTDFFLRRT